MTTVGDLTTREELLPIVQRMLNGFQQAAEDDDEEQCKRVLVDGLTDAFVLGVTAERRRGSAVRVQP
jgi:hypothetical protein